MQDELVDGADLRRVNPRYAAASAVFLQNANLSYADLTDAIVTDADLSGADLTNAILTQAQLDSACGDAETKLPAGLMIPHCLEASAAPQP